MYKFIPSCVYVVVYILKNLIGRCDPVWLVISLSSCTLNSQQSHWAITTGRSHGWTSFSLPRHETTVYDCVIWDRVVASRARWRDECHSDPLWKEGINISTNFNSSTSSPCCSSTVKFTGGSMLEAFSLPENVHTIWNDTSIREGSSCPRLSRACWVALNVIKSGGLKLKSDDEHSVMACIPFTSSLYSHVKSHDNKYTVDQEIFAVKKFSPVA